MERGNDELEFIECSTDVTQLAPQCLSLHLSVFTSRALNQSADD